MTLLNQVLHADASDLTDPGLIIFFYIPCTILFIIALISGLTQTGTTKKRK